MPFFIFSLFQAPIDISRGGSHVTRLTLQGYALTSHKVSRAPQVETGPIKFNIWTNQILRWLLSGPEIRFDVCWLAANPSAATACLFRVRRLSEPA